jgi:NTE family protein
VRLLVSATRVSDGSLRIFRNKDISLDAVMASACLPHLHHAVSVDGEPHWDGGYASNPPLLELVAASRASNVLLVQLIPNNGGELPKTVGDIDRRLAQITFNGPLQAELHALGTLQKLCRTEEEAGVTPLTRKLNKLRLHKIAAEDYVDGLTHSSVLNIDSHFLMGLRDAGRAAAEEWLALQDAEQPMTIHQ